jgi:hypothetical protein
VDHREILDFGPGRFEVWDYWGNQVFEASTREECEAWLSDNPEADEDFADGYDGQPDEAQEWADFDPDC